MAGCYHPPRSEHRRRAAVDVDARARHEARPLGHQERDHVGRLVGASHPPERHRPAHVLVERLRIDALTRRARVVALVDAALGEAELSPAMLVQRSGISRSELYRCFAPIGGIARVIQQRRLRQAYRELVRVDAPPSVSRIGEAVGFYDPSSFTRAFRREFGCTPSEVLTRRAPQASRAAPGLAAALSFR